MTERDLVFYGKVEIMKVERKKKQHRRLSIQIMFKIYRLYPSNHGDASVVW